MIGVFDSGFGGLHVLRGIAKELPEYGYVYAGDSARAPYGPKSVEEVYEFTKQGVEFLFAHGATFVILACNTASSEALRKIQQEYLSEGSAKKVLGVLIPFAEAAAARTRNKRVGVLATEGTVRSGSFPREITKVDDDIEVFQQACPGLVPLVEAGEQDSETAERLIREYLAPVVSHGVDTLVLGCTHYGLIQNNIRKALGEKNVQVISESEVVSKSLSDYLARHSDIERRLEKNVPNRFYSTGDIRRFERLGGIFFGGPIRAQRADFRI